MTLSLTIKLADCLSLLPIPNTSEVLWSLICDIGIIPWSHCRHYHYHAILDTQVFRAVQVWPSRQSRAWAGYPRIHVSVSSLSKQSCYDLLVHALLCQFDSEVSILAQQIKYFLFEPTEFSLNIALPCKEETSWQSRYNFNIFLDVRTRGDTHPCGHRSGGGKPVTESGEWGVSSRRLSSVSSRHRSWRRERKPLHNTEQKQPSADTGVVTKTSSTCFELQYPSRKVILLMKWFS